MSSVQLVIPIVVTPLLTRLLGATGYGHIAIANALSQVFFGLASLGLPVSIQKWFAGPDGYRRAKGLSAVAVIISFLTCAFALLTGYVWSPWVGFGSFGSLCILTAAWSASGTAATALGAFLRSEDNFRSFAVVTLTASVGVQAAGIAVAFAHPRSASSVLVGYAVAQGVGLCVALYLARPRWSGLRDTKDIRDALAFGLPLVPQQLATFVLYAGDRIVIQRLRGAQYVGRYQVAYNLGALAMFLLTFMSQAWLPRIFAQTDKVLQYRILNQSRDMTYRLLVPVVLGLSIGAPLVGRYWMPASYRPDTLVSVMVIIAVTTIPCADALASSRVLLAEGRTRSLATATFVAAVLNIGLNLVLLPALGLAGSALATFATYVALAFWSRALTQKTTRQATSARILVPLSGTLLLSVTSILAPLTTPWLIARGFSSLLCLLVLVVLLRKTGSLSASSVG